MCRTRSISPALSALLFLLLACGGDKPAEPAPAPTPEPSAVAPTPPAPTPPPAPAAPVLATPDEAGVVHITANDQMKYSATRIEVKAGKIKIELKNLGTLPKVAMGHNFVVLKPGIDVQAFALKTASAIATDYVPPGDADVLGHTKVLGPGESETLELELTAGTYPFVCTFPGHFALMRGELVVQ